MYYVEPNIADFKIGRVVVKVEKLPGISTYESQIEAFRKMKDLQVHDIGHVTGFSANAQNEILIMVVFVKKDSPIAIHPSNLIVV